jgi:hypothetical protein
METSLTGGGQIDSSDTFTILSFCSWIILLITSWLGVFILGLNKNEFIMFWLIEKNKYFNKIYSIEEPLDINFAVFNIIVITTLIIEALGFLIFLYSLYKRDNNVVNGMFGDTSKFHFIPLLLISAIFITSECYSNSKDSAEAKIVFVLIFTFLAIVASIFISFRIKIESPVHAALIIKGVFSCFLALLIYNFGYTFTMYGIFKKANKGNDYFNWRKRCTLAFTILIGILNNAVAFLLKDALISIINFLIYLGMTINYFRLHKEIRKLYLYKNETVGVFDIIMMILSIAYIAFHIFRFRGIIPKQD